MPQAHVSRLPFDRSFSWPQLVECIPFARNSGSWYYLAMSQDCASLADASAAVVRNEDRGPPRSYENHIASSAVPHENQRQSTVDISMAVVIAQRLFIYHCTDASLHR